MPRLTVLLAVLWAPSLIAQNIHPTPAPDVTAVPLREEIHLDGKLDEAVWRTAQPATGFRQSQPHSGDPATQCTEVRFAYDDAAIYVGARMFDDSGSRGVRTRLVRRDADMNSDYLEVIFDTYHDHIGRLFFQVNPSGVKYDANGLGGGGDPSWDPVWEVQTNIDSLGWTAEMRIPFSQLRYPNTSEEQTWGLQIWRQENRLNELSQWAWWGLDETGGPPRFGHLRGLVIRHAPGRAEVMPYVVGRSSNVPGNQGDPFFNPHALDGRVGGDATLRVTSNLTLNATINPDFGQVEVDPAVVNLSAFETFFDEKRPFFVARAGARAVHGQHTRAVNRRADDQLLRVPGGQGSAGRRHADQGDGDVRLPGSRRSLCRQPVVASRRGLRHRHGLVVEQAHYSPDGAIGGHRRRGRHGGDAAHPVRLGAFLPAARPVRHRRRLASPYVDAGARRLRADGEGIRPLALGGLHQLPHAGIQQQRRRVLLARRLLVGVGQHFPDLDQADQVVSPAVFDRRRAAAIQLRRRPQRPAGPDVRAAPDLELLVAYRILDSPAQRVRRPVDARRPRGAAAGAPLLPPRRSDRVTEEKTPGI